MRWAPTILLLLLASTTTAQRRVGQSNVTVPVPADPHELVSGQVRDPTPAESAGELALLQRSLQNSRLMYAGMGPFRLEVSFSAVGQGTQGGMGQLSQTWLSPQTWRWSASLGGISVVRGSSARGAYAEGPSVPMRVQMLRDAIFSPMYNVAVGTHLRSAAVVVGGKPAICLMTSGVIGPAANSGRLWEELEYCFDTASGRLLTASFAPGVFAVYGYETAQTIHGHTLPDRVSVYVAGSQVLDATVHAIDATGTDPSTLQPTPGSQPRQFLLNTPSRLPLPLAAPQGTSKVSAVLVHANVVDGKVVEAEICAASDAALAGIAIEAVKRIALERGVQQQVYFNVKFVPPGS